jgi:CBS-domain-containing membrane protein
MFLIFAYPKGDPKMNREYFPLTEHSLKPGASFLKPAQELPERITLDDPAASAMTDLSRVAVVTTRAQASMDRAHDKMKRCGVRMLLVLDETDKVLGILTTTDILGEKPMRFLKHSGGTHADIQVGDIMTPHRDLQVLALSDVLGAKVGHILATLKSAGRQHALVVTDRDDGGHALCGIFSATQIARQLGAQIQIEPVARTFAQVEEALADSHILI